MSIEATWPGNFRDLGASITRMATLATQGRITVEAVDEETARLRRLWGGARRGAGDDALLEALLGDELAGVDRFDRVQLAEVLRVCAAARSASDAGRSLFQASREKRSSSNDADRLRKYLKRFGLDFPQIQAAARRL